jgi:hypothetical protein
MSTSNPAKANKPSNTRRPSVRFAETAQTIFSITDEDQPEENEEADLGGSRRNEGASSQRPRASGDGAATTPNHHIYNHSPKSSSSSSPPSKYRTTYGLKSTASSREAEFEADDSDVEVDDPIADPSIAMSSTRVPHRRSSSLSALPLIDRIPGLPMAMDRARRSISEGANHNLRESLRNAMESEELPDWLRRGAGVLDSTWNMSNSILGAGVVGES